MKNLLLIFAVLLCVYLYVHPRVETRVETVPVAAAVPPPTPRPVLVPTPTPELKLYYHSALDAPAMYSGSTATGYFSTDPTTATGPHLSGSTYGSAYNGSPYYYPYGGGTVNNTVIYNNGTARPATAARACPTPLPSTYAGRPRLVPPADSARGSDLARVQKQD